MNSANKFFKRCLIVGSPKLNGRLAIARLANGLTAYKPGYFSAVALLIGFISATPTSLDSPHIEPATQHTILESAPRATLESAPGANQDLPKTAIMRLSQHSSDGEWNGVYMLEFSKDDLHLAARTRDHAIQIYDLNKEDLIARLDGHDGFVKSMLFLQDEQRLASVASGGEEKIIIWNYRSGENVAEVSGGGEFLELNEQGDLVVIDELERRTVNLEKGSVTDVVKLRLPGEQIIGVKPGSEQFAVFRSSQRNHQFAPVRIVNSRNKERHLLKGLESRPKRAVFSSNQQFVAAVYQREAQAYMWDLEGGMRKFLLDGHQDRIETICFSADNRFLATSSWDQTVKIWDVINGKTIATLEGHEGNVCAVCFSNDSKLLASGATGNKDCSVLIWDLEKNIYSGCNEVRRRTNEEPSLLWELLGSDDSNLALGAVAILSEQFEQYRETLEREISSTLQVTEAELIQRYIDDLGHQDYQTRLDAFAQLQKIRAVAENKLRENLASTRSAEIRIQISRLLSEPIKRPKIAQHQWRRLQRLVHSLERINNGASRDILLEISNGHRHVDISRAAAEALNRLKTADQ